jgi:3-oxoacyl-[acyl-carrier-protein] synthase III
MEKIRHAKISVEFGGALGKHFVSNQEYVDLVRKNYPDSGIKEAHELNQKTLITKRPYSEAGLKRLETGVDISDNGGFEVNSLSYQAVLELKEKLQDGLEDLDMIIVACSNGTENGNTISHALHLRERMGLSSQVQIQTINLACSGFVEAVILAKDYIIKGANKILVVGVDEMSRILDHSGKDGWLLSNLFGDGGGACVVSASERCGIINSRSVSPKSPYSNLTVPGLSYLDEMGHVCVDKSRFASMKGNAVSKFVLTEVPEVFLDLVSSEKYWYNELDMCIPHQANARLISESLTSSIAKKTIERGCDGSQGFLEERVRELMVTEGFKTVGNLSAGSIPQLISTLRDLPQYSSSWRESRIVSLIGFGAGPRVSGVTVLL